jgi:hypothetical protein
MTYDLFFISKWKSKLMSQAKHTLLALEGRRIDNPALQDHMEKVNKGSESFLYHYPVS